MQRSKVIIDTCVFINALSEDDEAARKAIKDAFEYADVVFSKDIFDELVRILQLKIEHGSIQSETAGALLEAIEQNGTFHAPDLCLGLCADSEDDMFFDLAYSYGADVIVSRDKKVLNVAFEVGNLRIVTPELFSKDAGLAFSRRAQNPHPTANTEAFLEAA